jgi:type I restriction enzyme, S subunit
VSAALGAVKDSKWTTTIGQLCDKFGGEVQTGPFGSQLHASDYSQDGTPVVMPQDMHDGTVVCDKIARVGNEHVQLLRRHALRSGDIVYSRRGDVARFAVITEREAGWLCGTGSIRIRLNCPDIDIRYLRHYLQQDVVGDWLKHNAKGVTMLNLNTAIIRGLPFVYPPLPEQRRIAAILDKTDALRTKRREAIAKLDQLLQSVFLEMFGDPVTNPKGWPVLKSGELYSEKPRIGTTQPATGRGCLVVRVGELGAYSVALEKSSRVELGSLEFERYSLRAGDTVIARAIGSKDQLGKCSYFDNHSEPVCIDSHVMRLRPDPLKIEPAWFYCLLSSSAGKRMLQSKGGATAVQFNINTSQVSDIDIPLPPLALQRKFLECSANVRSQVVHSLNAADALTDLFSSLQQRAFTGTL